MNHSHTEQRSADTLATTTSAELLVNGMTCNNCARHVTEAIQSVPGVRSASVMLESGRATVRWEAEARSDVPAVVLAIKQAGYDAKAIEATAQDNEEHQSGWHFNLWIGVVGTVPLMAGEWIFGLSLTPWFGWLSFVLAGVVQVFAGAQFYRGAWRQLKVGSSNMDTLVALGSTTAFGYSFWALLSGQGGHLYFMEAAAIITLISVGHWIEARVSARASSALKSLLNLAPQTARRLEVPNPPHPAVRHPHRESVHGPGHPLNPSLSPSGGEGVRRTGEGEREPLAVAEIVVPVSELKPDDLVVLKPGDRVPTDGVVAEGESAVDESMLTGESVPVDKTAGAEVYAGTMNLNGRLVMRVTATGENTALAHIVAAVQRAQTSRANIQRLGDRVSSVFVPVVVGIALAAALWWGLAPESAAHVHSWLAKFLWPAHLPIGEMATPFIIAAAVLIIACPCAMGLATPAAIMAGANAAARRGILIRDGVALEKAGQVTAIVFDKTGTLTFGKPVVVKTWETDSSEKTLALAAALARHSTHPISQAVAKLSTEVVEWTAWEEIHGAGVRGKLRLPQRENSPNQDFALWPPEPPPHPATGHPPHEPSCGPMPPHPALSPVGGEGGRRPGEGATGDSGVHGETKTLQFGSLSWLREGGTDLSAGESFIREWTGQGATVVGLAVDSTLQALIAVKDTTKPDAAEVVAQLHRQGLKIFLLTGDNALTAASIAKEVGIAAANVSAEVRPEQKAAFVKGLQQRGERVAFVGDGINDAPALEQADLGIAVSRASDIAREAADIILLRSEIDAVPEALGLARATLRTIKQNLFWAFFYNAIGVPLAALGFMSPILCAAAMGVSDLVVIGNALRLRQWPYASG